MDCCLKSGAAILNNMGQTIEYDSSRDTNSVSKYRKTNKQHKKVQKPWWDSECEAAVANRRKAFKELKQRSSREFIATYRRVSHDTRRTLNKRKRENFKAYINNINDNFSIAGFWDCVSKLRNCSFNNISSFSTPTTSKIEMIHNTINKLTPC